MRLSAIQLCSVPDVETNLAQIKHHLTALTEQYNDQNPHLVVLPESCLYFGGRDKEQLNLIEPELAKSIQQTLAGYAQRFGVYLVAGTIPLACEQENKFTASSFIFSPSGERIAEYQKMHLFDVFVEDSAGNYLESKYTQAGKSSIVTQIDHIGVGQSVCYDIRFPELFRQMATMGADVITVPAAFTRVTGKAHWQVLLQARAIENQVYVVASAQEGVHKNGRETWGHSMIIDPWGEVIAELPTGEGFVSALVDTDKQAKIRQNIPVAGHNRFNVSKKTSTG